MPRWAAPPRISWTSAGEPACCAGSAPARPRPAAHSANIKWRSGSRCCARNRNRAAARRRSSRRADHRSNADPAVWLDRVREALRRGTFLDYRRAIDFGRDAERLLDELEDALDAGAADAVRPALERATTRLRTVLLRADDSEGEIARACFRATELFARSCREGNPDGPKLARWLLKFRLPVQGWSTARLADFAPAFDEKAWRIYRQGVAAAAARPTNPSSSDEAEIRRMQLELFDHDGDLDGAIGLLAHGQRPEYGAIITRLQGAGRDQEVMDWLDRAMRDGRIWYRDDDVHLSFRTAAELYTAAGRPADAVAVWRRGFAESPGPGTLQALLAAAGPLGAEHREREWAIGMATEQAAGRYGNGAVLIEIALAEGDLDAAIAAAERYEPGRTWERLALACVADRPGVAAEMYQAAVDRELETSKVENYRAAIEHLGTLRGVYRSLGRDDLFADYARGVRERNIKRPRFLELFDRRIRR